MCVEEYRIEQERKKRGREGKKKKAVEKCTTEQATETKEQGDEIIEGVIE